LVLRNIELRNRTRDKPMTRAQFTVPMLKRLLNRPRLAPEFVEGVSAWLAVAGWCLFNAGPTYAAVRISAVKNWPRLARCHCCKQWRAPLIKLHQEWNDILSALRWAESCGQAYSVDGKLALLTKWRRAQSGNADPSQGTRARSRSDALLRENALLKERLSARRPIS
jgi:hypothetical protein